MKQKLYDIAHVVISLNGGGTENLVVNLIEHLCYNACCICLDNKGSLASRLEEKGVDVIELNRKPGIAFNIPRLIAGVIKKHKIKILHCHQYSPWFYGIITKIYIPNLKVIYTEHGRPYPDISKLKRKIFNTFFSRITDSVTAVSPFIRESLWKNEAFHKDKIKVIFNGIDVPQISLDKIELRKKLDLQTDKLYAILPARFNPIKWHDGLIRAFLIVKSQIPEAQLILPGIGETMGQIKNLIKELKLSGDIILPGYQNNVQEWIAASDVFVLSSHSEGTSVSLLESMALGLPCAVTEVGGNPYIVESGITGLLSPRGDVHALAENLIKLFINKRLRLDLGRAAKKSFLKKFTFSIMADSYCQLYNNYIKN